MLIDKEVITCEVIFIGGEYDGLFEVCNHGIMFERWQLAGYHQCNGYIGGRLMLIHDDFIIRYSDKC